MHLYPYILGFTLFGIMVGQVLKGFGLYQINPTFVYFQPFIFLAWFTVTAWTYIKSEKIVLR